MRRGTKGAHHAAPAFVVARLFGIDRKLNNPDGQSMPTSAHIPQMMGYQLGGKAPSIAALLTADGVLPNRAAISFRPRALQMSAAVVSVCACCSMSELLVQYFCTCNRIFILSTKNLYRLYSAAMEIKQKENLSLRGDMSREAMALRILAARHAVGMGQDELAHDMGEGMTKQKLRNAEKADNDPPKALMRYFYRAHRIDFNFLLHGDFAQLPADVQARLFGALSALTSVQDQKPD